MQAILPNPAIIHASMCVHYVFIMIYPYVIHFIKGTYF